MTFRIAIEGNIGAGKTTALDAIRTAFPHIATVPEPVDEWAPLFALFSQDPAAWALALQLKVLLSFAKKPVVGRDVCVYERCPVSCHHVFGKMLYDDGKLTQAEWDTFKEYADALGWVPDAVIYLDVPPETCLERIQARGRDFEKNIDIAYLRRVEFQYDTMMKFLPPGYDVVRVKQTGDTAQQALVGALASMLEKIKKME